MPNGSLWLPQGILTSVNFSLLITSKSRKNTLPCLIDIPYHLIKVLVRIWNKRRHQPTLDVTTNQGQSRVIWTYHLSKFDFSLYHGGPTLQSRITQKWLELSPSFFHIMKIWDICGHLQLV